MKLNKFNKSNLFILVSLIGSTVYAADSTPQNIQADQLNRQAANALLKMLEEPPAKTLIILLAHQLGRVLPTILSRSTKIAFHPISDAEMQNIFPHLSEDTLQFISGCPGRAQENKDIKQPLHPQHLQQPRG